MFTMRMKVRAAIVVVGMSAAAVGSAVPASADPADGSCPFAISLMCNFLPVQPDLDHDVDLTQEPAVINGHSLPEMPGGGQALEHAPADGFS